MQRGFDILRRGHRGRGRVGRAQERGFLYEDDSDSDGDDIIEDLFPSSEDDSDGDAIEEIAVSNEDDSDGDDIEQLFPNSEDDVSSSDADSSSNEEATTSRRKSGSSSKAVASPPESERVSWLHSFISGLRAEEIQREADRIPSVKTVTWNPFSLFPQEIWEIIFGNLDSRDMENVINATPEWRKMYQPKMATILFQEAFNILAKDDTYLRRRNYFKCRRVCKTWDQAVQNFIQLHPVHFAMILEDEDELCRFDQMDSFKYRHQEWQKESFDWSNAEEIQSSLEEMAKTHPSGQNPFICRQITLQDNGVYFPRRDRELAIAECNRWCSTVVKLLEKYGSHVWDCNISYSKNLLPLTCYINMQHWMSLMGHLKVLDLEYCIKGPFQQSEWNDLVNQIGMSPLPELKDLIFLKTRDVPAPVFNELIQKSKNLQKLQIKLSGKKTALRLSHYQLNTLASPNLTECQLTLVCPEDFKFLGSSKVAPWPLRKLYLHLEYESGSVKTKTYSKWSDWNGLFKVIEKKFGRTLRELKIRLPKAATDLTKKKILNESPKYRLNLPHLENLRVVVPNLTSFDFLLPLKSLKELTIVVDHRENERDDINASSLKLNETLKFNGNFNRLFETNVWDVLPKLKKVTLTIARKPTRPGNYEPYCFQFYDKEKMKHTDSDQVAKSALARLESRLISCWGSDSDSDYSEFD